MGSSGSKTGRKALIIKILAVVIAAVMAAAGIFIFRRYRTFSGYSSDAVLEMSNSGENTSFYPYGSGYLKCSGDGIIYFDRDGIKWSEYYSFTQPLISVCGEYIAACDLEQRAVYIYDKSGYVNSFTISHDILGIAVSRNGVTAIASNDGNINYIEICDKNGGEIMTQKSIFSSNGFLMDLDISEDGTKLAAVFVTVEKGTLRSKTVFYNLSGSEGTSDVIAGTFDQFGSILLTSIRFMENDRICAVGDNGYIIFSFRDVPEIVCQETDIIWEIQSLFFNDRYMGMIVTENGSEAKYTIKVFDTDGELKLEQETDFSYSNASFAGNNVLLYSYMDCMMYSMAGIQKFYYTFDRHIEALASSDGRHFVYGTNSNTEFITLR